MLSLLFAIALTPQEPSQAACRFSRGSAYVQVKVEGQKYWALVGTGAGKNTISSRVMKHPVAFGFVQLENGLKSVRLERSTDPFMPIDGDVPVDVVLGMDFFERSVLLLDFARSQVRMWDKPDAAVVQRLLREPRYGGELVGSCALSRTKDLEAQVEVVVEGEKRTAILDSSLDTAGFENVKVPVSFTEKKGPGDDSRTASFSLVKIETGEEAAYSVVLNEDAFYDSLPISFFTEEVALFDFATNRFHYAPLGTRERSRQIVKQILGLTILDGVIFDEASGPLLAWVGTADSKPEQILSALDGVSDKTITSIRERIPEWRGDALFQDNGDTPVLRLLLDGYRPGYTPPRVALPGYFWRWVPRCGWSEIRIDSPDKFR
jgi:hypothetical protein